MRMVTEKSCSLLKYWMDISQLRWTSTKVIPTGKTLAGSISVVITLSTYFLQTWESSAFFFHYFLHIIIMLKLFLIASQKVQNLKILWDAAPGSRWGAYGPSQTPKLDFSPISLAQFITWTRLVYHFCSSSFFHTTPTPVSCPYCFAAFIFCGNPSWLILRAFHPTVSILPFSLFKLWIIFLFLIVSCSKLYLKNWQHFTMQWSLTLKPNLTGCRFSYLFFMKISTVSLPQNCYLIKFSLFQFLRDMIRR